MTDTTLVFDRELPTVGLDEVALAVEDLRTSFKRSGAVAEIVRGVSFRIQQGRTLAILGESGSGKSVTARSVLGLYGKRATITGSVRVAGQELIGESESRLAALRGSTISFVPQDPNGSLDPLRRVRSQLKEMIKRGSPGSGRAFVSSRVIELLNLVGIRDPERVAHSYPHELSGGMRQRIAIALAVSLDPKVLIADEPTTALDPTVQKQILALFNDLQSRMGTAMIFVTHDVDVARTIADDVAVMFAGKFVEFGEAESVLTTPSHPYTRALLAAVPTPNSVRGKLPTVEQSLKQSGLDPTDWIIK